MTKTLEDPPRTTQGIWKIGELAARLGTTTRTLHHWERIGLVSPGRASEGGHRVYGPRDVQRLQKIRLLRSLGLGLGEIRTLLEDGDLSLAQVLRVHRERLRKQMQGMRSLIDKLEGLEAYLASGRSATTDELFDLLEMMMDFEKYYTKEQLAQLAKRREALGEEGMRQGQQDWQDLIAEVRAAAQAGTPPDSATGRELAARWNALIEAFTGGDPGIRESLANAYRSQPGAMEQMGIDAEMRDWIGRASKPGPDPH